MKWSRAERRSSLIDDKDRVSLHSWASYSDSEFLESLERWVEHIWGYGKRVGGWRSDFIMTTGLSGEVGEVLEILKKSARKNSGLSAKDRENLVEELGDVLYYLVKVANRYDIELKEVIQRNFSKLEKRYEEHQAGTRQD